MEGLKGKCIMELMLFKPVICLLSRYLSSSTCLVSLLKDRFCISLLFIGYFDIRFNKKKQFFSLLVVKVAWKMFYV